VPPPPPDEVVIVDRPVLMFADSDFDFPPPPPLVVLAPPPEFIVDLAPPPPPVDEFFLPTPEFAPLPVWVDIPVFVAPPPVNIIFFNIHNTVIINQNTVVVKDPSGKSVPPLANAVAAGAIPPGAGLPPANPADRGPPQARLSQPDSPAARASQPMGAEPRGGPRGPQPRLRLRPGSAQDGAARWAGPAARPRESPAPPAWRTRIQPPPAPASSDLKASQGRPATRFPVSQPLSRSPGGRSRRRSCGNGKFSLRPRSKRGRFCRGRRWRLDRQDRPRG
jgi:hypothetical protein